ncbi:MAG: hypothetical protein Q7W30_10880 [Coriobacteriia bacterium]|nr:hypothetical protein [Coriobacteriia bacterium]
MEKLERVLAAEEEARQTVADARERASRARTDGAGAARTAVERIATNAAAAAAAERDQVMGVAAAEAAELTQQAGSTRDSAVTNSAAKMDDAVARLLGALGV